MIVECCSTALLAAAPTVQRRNIHQADQDRCALSRRRQRPTSSPHQSARVVRSSEGQPVIVETARRRRHIGAEYVFKAEPDGYTLLSSPPLSSSIRACIGSSLRPTQFVPIGIMVAIPTWCS